jgi:acyl-CoA thioester hydrolase
VTLAVDHRALGRQAVLARGSRGGRGTLTAAMPAPFVHRLRVRYGECDPQGWVFNAHYLSFFDVAITELWREAIGPYAGMAEQGVDMVVAEATLRFRSPARFDELIDVALEIARLGTTAMTTRFRITNAGGTVVEGEVRHVFIAIDGGGKVPIPRSIRGGLEPYVAEQPSASPAEPVDH